MRDFLKLLIAGEISELLDVYRALKSKDPDAIAKELGEALGVFDQPEYAPQLKLLAAQIKAEDTAGMIAESLRLAALVADEFRKTNPDGTPRIVMMATPVMTRAEAKAWLAVNRADAVRGADTPIVKRMMNRHPEVRRLLEGTMTAQEVAAIDPERLAKIVDWLRVVAKVAAFAGAFYPPALVLAQVLNLIIAFYDARNPTTGAAADVGLSLEDLL